MHNPTALEALLDPDAAGRVLNRSGFTLKRWRQQGTGPRFCVVGGRPLYDPNEIRSWLAGRTVGSSVEHRVRVSEVTAP